jgi:Kef-type K+ transport system membrane component KefB
MSDGTGLVPDRPSRPWHVYGALVLLPALLAGGVVWWISRRATAGSAVAGAAADPLPRLLAAIVVVIALSSLCGVIAVRLGQPRVIGEMIAGVLIGPSALGLVLPQAQHWLFNSATVPYLDILAQLGVVFFMFLVGHETSMGAVGRGGLAIGGVAIAVPFLAGSLVAGVLPDNLRPPGVNTTAFVLFIALAMSITAFPVLARILDEQRLLSTRLGATAMTAAGVADVTGWCLLTLVVAILGHNSPYGVFVTVALTVGFAALMLKVVRPVLARALARRQGGDPATLGVLVCLVLSSALATGWIGVHPIFGAFLAGLVMPRDAPVIRYLTHRIEGLTLWLMLPLFFATVGLKTRLDALTGAAGWASALLIVAVAIASKFAGTYAAARLSRFGRRAAAGLSVMMNCRGLTELVVLNIGLSLGVISPQLFAAFLIATLVTTAMTGPLLRRLRLPIDQPTGLGGATPATAVPSPHPALVEAGEDPWNTSTAS